MAKFIFLSLDKLEQNINKVKQALFDKHNVTEVNNLPKDRKNQLALLEECLKKIKILNTYKAYLDEKNAVSKADHDIKNILDNERLVRNTKQNKIRRINKDKNKHLNKINSEYANVTIPDKDVFDYFSKHFNNPVSASEFISGALWKIKDEIDKSYGLFGRIFSGPYNSVLFEENDKTTGITPENPLDPLTREVAIKQFIQHASVLLGKDLFKDEIKKRTESANVQQHLNNIRLFDKTKLKPMERKEALLPQKHTLKA